MRKWWIVVVFLMVGCVEETPLDMVGIWSLDRLESYEEYWLYDLTVTTDTSFNDVQLFFDTLGMYTVIDDTLKPVSVVGYWWSMHWLLNWELDTALWIGGEPWSLIVEEPNKIIVENKTRYGIVGEQVRTLYMTKE